MSQFELTLFERDVLNSLLCGDHPVLSVLRVQLQSSVVSEREWTGCGFFTRFQVAQTIPPCSLTNRFTIGGDVQAQIDGLKHGAGFVLFVENGFLSTLEGFSYDEPWQSNPAGWKVSYTADGQRDMTFLDNAR